MKNKKRVIPICCTCENCTCIGEGDFLCIENQVIVKEDYMPNDNYCYCNGTDYIEEGEYNFD